MDRIRDVAEETPVIRADKGWVDKDLIFGVDSSLARNLTDAHGVEKQSGDHHDHNSEVDVLSLTFPSSTEDADGGFVDTAALEKLLTTAPKDEIYRIKGILRFRIPPPQHPDTPFSSETAIAPPTSNRWVLNWAFGRWTFTPLRESSVTTTIEGANGSLSPVELPPSEVVLNSDTQAVIAGLKHRKGSIEVMVQTSIKTTVERKTSGSCDCARLSFVLARGESNRWKSKLEKNEFLRFDRPGVEPKLSVQSIS